MTIMTLKSPGTKTPWMVKLGRTVPQRLLREKMTKMFVNFCPLSSSSAKATVVYFGVSTKDKLVDFCEEQWKDMFDQWQKCHTCPDGREHAITLAPPQQDRIWCAAWA